LVAFTPGELVGAGGPAKASLSIDRSIPRVPCAALTATICASIFTPEVCRAHWTRYSGVALTWASSHAAWWKAPVDR
jgi:hypothetical protein